MAKTELRVGNATSKAAEEEKHHKKSEDGALVANAKVADLKMEMKSIITDTESIVAHLISKASEEDKRRNNSEEVSSVANDKLVALENEMKDIMTETNYRRASNAGSKGAAKKEDQVGENDEIALCLEELPNWMYDYIKSHNNSVIVMYRNTQSISIKVDCDLLEPFPDQEGVNFFIYHFISSCGGIRNQVKGILSVIYTEVIIGCICIIDYAPTEKNILNDSFDENINHWNWRNLKVLNKNIE